MTFIATAEARDDEMARRIAAHKAERPAEWPVIEEPLDLQGAIGSADHGSLVIIDCLTLWLSNAMEEGLDANDIKERSLEVASIAAARAAGAIVVSNEVGSGIVPMSELARDYQDLLGTVNSIWAAAADDAYLVVAGRALALRSLRGEPS